MGADYSFYVITIKTNACQAAEPKKTYLARGFIRSCSGADIKNSQMSIVMFLGVANFFVDHWHWYVLQILLKAYSLKKKIRENE